MCILFFLSFFVTSLIDNLQITDFQAGVDTAAELAAISKQQHLPEPWHEGCLWHRVCLPVGAARLSSLRVLVF